MRRAIDQDVLEERALAFIQATDLNLLDITGTGAFQIGAKGPVWAGDRAISREWSKAIHNHPDMVDGICYAGNHNASEFSVALFDRAQGKVTLNTTVDWLQLPGLGTIMDAYGIAYL